MIDFVAAVPIKTKTAPRELAIIVAGADEFDQPFKTTERRRRFGVQIEYDLVMRHLDILACDHDGGFGGECVMSHAMRNESDGLISPQQFVEAARGIFVRCVDDDA